MAPKDFTIKDFKIQYRVEAPAARSLRVCMAKILMWVMARLLKVRFRAFADTHKPTRQAEADNHREMIYRGTRVESPTLGPSPLKPLFDELTRTGGLCTDPDCLICRPNDEIGENRNLDPNYKARLFVMHFCAGCTTSISPLTSYSIYGEQGCYCKDCFDQITALQAACKPAPELHDPSPQGHVRCQVCDYPTFKLAQVGGLSMCGWCAIQAPVANRENL